MIMGVLCRLSLLVCLLAPLVLAFNDGLRRDELGSAEEDFLIVTESGEDERRMGRPFDQGLPPPPPIVPIPTPLPEGNNPIAERDGCGLPICTPGECLPICTPGARNTTAAPTNGTTALPRAFLRKLIQAGYRVVPPAKYGGPPEQAMNPYGSPYARGYPGVPRPHFPAMAPWGQAPPYGPGPYRPRMLPASAPGYAQYGVHVRKQPGFAGAPRAAGFVPQMPPPAIIGSYPGAAPAPYGGYPGVRKHRHAVDPRVNEEAYGQAYGPESNGHQGGAYQRRYPQEALQYPYGYAQKKK